MIMKELIIKIKHWLIKKLGGYTEQYINNRTISMRTHRFKPVKLQSAMFVDDYLYRTLPEQEMLERLRQIKREMAYHLADKLVEDDLILVSCYDDPIQCQRKYIAELSIIHPHDAAMCMF